MLVVSIGLMQTSSNKDMLIFSEEKRKKETSQTHTHMQNVY